MIELFARVRLARDHRWASGQMSAYLDHELPAAARARMERHVGDCPRCRQLLASLRRLVDGLHRLPAAASTPASADGYRIAAAVRDRLAEPPSPPS